MDDYIVIPAHNEQKHIEEVIKKTKKYCKNIIVVDDGSTDDTFVKAKKQDIIVLKHIINLGKGAALRTGCDYAYMQKATKIIVMDADGQHDPKEIPNFLEGLNEDHQIIFGSRQLSKNMPFVLRFGNWFINKTNQFLYKINLNDTQCGYRAFTSETYKKIRWQASDYSMESEMIAKVRKHRLKHKEIPIQTIYSDNYKGTTVIDGIKIVFNMLIWRIKI